MVMVMVMVNGSKTIRASRMMSTTLPQVHEVRVGGPYGVLDHSRSARSGCGI